MRIVHLLAVLSFAVTVSTGVQSLHQASEMLNATGNQRIGPAMILWNTGLVETITPVLVQNRVAWRITHYPQDPTESKTNDYDLYDVDRATLAPLRSVMNTAEYHLELIFAKKEVTLRKTTDQGTAAEQIPLLTNVQPEGPGLDVFVASLPLAVGYKKRYAIVDRWAGHGSTRVKTLSLSVSEKATKDTALGKREVFELSISPDDNSFQIRERVLVESPHFPVWVEYRRDGKTYPISEVTSIVSNPRSEQISIFSR